MDADTKASAAVDAKASLAQPVTPAAAPPAVSNEMKAYMNFLENKINGSDNPDFDKYEALAKAIIKSKTASERDVNLVLQHKTYVENMKKIDDEAKNYKNIAALQATAAVIKSSESKLNQKFKNTEFYKHLKKKTDVDTFIKLIPTFPKITASVTNFLSYYNKVDTSFKSNTELKIGILSLLDTLVDKYFEDNLPKPKDAELIIVDNLLREIEVKGNNYTHLKTQTKKYFDKFINAYVQKIKDYVKTIEPMYKRGASSNSLMLQSRNKKFTRDQAKQIQIYKKDIKYIVEEKVFQSYVAGVGLDVLLERLEELHAFMEQSKYSILETFLMAITGDTYKKKKLEECYQKNCTQSQTVEDCYENKIKDNKKIDESCKTVFRHFLKIKVPSPKPSTPSLSFKASATHAVFVEPLSNISRQLFF